MNKLTIDPNLSFDSIRIQFRNQFPFLDLQCFKIKHGNEEGSNKKSMLNPDTQLSSLMQSSHTLSVTYSPADTVRQIVEKFKAIAGLNVHVFRKSGKNWLETTVTDNWSLQQQNEEGERSLIEIKEEPENAEDHDIY